MDVPVEFHTFCVQFYADLDLDDDPMQAIQESVASGLQMLTAEGKNTLKSFFEKVLKDDLTDDELENLWCESPADILLNGAAVKHVMSEALKKI